MGRWGGGNFLIASPHSWLCTNFLAASSNAHVTSHSLHPPHGLSLRALRTGPVNGAFGGRRRVPIPGGLVLFSLRRLTKFILSSPMGGTSPPLSLSLIHI